METYNVTIPIETYTELTVEAADCASIKRILLEKKRTYSELSYNEIYSLCVMFGLLDESGDEE